MRYWTGLLLFAGAAWLLRSALARRARVRAAAGEGRVAPPASASLAMMGDVLPPMIILALGFVGVKMTFAYFAFGGSRVLSLFDLAGLLALLAAYGTSVVFATRYREPLGMPEPAPALAPQEAPAPAPAKAA